MAMIDVVLPTHNHAKLLPVALDSILAQTFKDFTLTVINDGSKDDTPQVLERYKDPRFSIIHQKNKKIPWTLNYGHSLGQSPYLTWVSDDNTSMPTHFEKMLAFISAGDYDFIQTDCIWDIHGIRRVVNMETHNGPLGHGNLGPSFLYKRTLWEKIKYDEKLYGIEDLDFYLSVKRSGAKMAVLHEPLVVYNWHPAMHTRKFQLWYTKMLWKQVSEKHLDGKALKK
jgi:glycosyltransferase involved in cell wall biosynthesis